MATKTKPKPKAQLVRVELPIIDEKGKPFAKAVITEILDEYEILKSDEIREALSDDEINDMNKRMKARGGYMDYRQNLLTIMALPKSERGANYAEIKLAFPIIDKLEEADEGGHVMLDDTQFKYLTDAIERNGFKIITRRVRTFLEDVIGSEKVPVEQTT